MQLRKLKPAKLRESEMVAPKNQKRTLLNGLNPLSYQGVEPTSPSDFVTDVRDPVSGTTQDYQGWDVGDEWENRLTHDVFKLVSKDGGVATWTKFVTGTGDITTLKDDSGTVIVPDITGSISVVGGELINTVAGVNTLTVNLDQALDGQIPIAATGGATIFANIVAGANVVVTDGPNSVTISAAGGGAGDLTAIGNDGSTATSAMGSMNILGVPGHTVTSGDLADTFTIDLPAALTAVDSLTNTNTAFALNTGTGALSISNDASATTVNLGTGAAAKTVTLGSTTTTSKLDLKYGTNDFTLASATGTSVSATDGGIVTTPRNPSFFAYIIPELNVTGDSTIHFIGSVTSMAEAYDIGGHFFPGDGAGNPATYTIPVDGTYLFTWDLSAHINATGGLEMQWYLYDGGNGFGTVVLPTRNRVAGFYGVNNYIAMTSSVVKFFTAGTILTLAFVSGPGAKVDEAESGFWSGCLIG